MPSKELDRPRRRAPARSSPVAAYLARLAKGSRPTMARALERIARMVTDEKLGARVFPWHELRYEHTAAIRAALMDLELAPATVNKHLAALRCVLREAGRLGLIPPAELARAIDLPPARGSRLPAGRELSAGELRALFDDCAGAGAGAAGARDAALLALLYAGGLRRAEAAELELDDYDQEDGSVKVRGKGDKERLAYLPAGGRAAIAAWLAHRGDIAGPLICPVRKNGLITIRRMTEQAIYNRARARARSAGVAAFSPHDCRRSFISHLLAAGADIATVQKMAGHEDVSTTARYDRRDEGAKQQAAELLHVPFTPAPAAELPET